MAKVLIVYALAETFRRAGTTFTQQGTAFPDGHFNEQQLAAIHSERRLSVRELDQSQIPDGVDTRWLAAGPAGAADEEAPAQAGQANQSTAAAAATLVEAFALLSPDNPDDFTKTGLPQLDALSRLLGRPVPAAERDAAWASYNTTDA